MTQAILLKDVDRLGERGDIVDVSPGYLRNFLLPRKLAHTATPASIAEAKRRMTLRTVAYRRHQARSVQSTVPTPLPRSARFSGHPERSLFPAPGTPSV